MPPPTSLPPPPVELLELATGYQRARTLFSLVELAVPTMLADGPLAREVIAQRLGVHRLAADRFLNACVALGLVVRDGVAFGNAPAAATFLVQGAPTYLPSVLDAAREYIHAEAMDPRVAVAAGNFKSDRCPAATT